jgi:hypothetical protein
MVNMVLSGKQATGYLPAGGEYQISALRVGGSLPVGGQGLPPRSQKNPKIFSLDFLFKFI